MRRLMYVAVGFATACGVCAYMDGEFVKYCFSAGLLLLLCLPGGSVPFVRKLTLSVFGCALGFFWFSQFYGTYLAPVLPLDGESMYLSIRASDYGEKGKYAVIFDGTVDIGEHTYLIHARLKENEQIQPGMIVSGDFNISVLDTGIRPGQGVFLAARQKDEIKITWDSEHWQDRVAHLRREIKHALEETFPEDACPFAKALLLGDTSELSYEVDTDLKISGIRHVVAVSGLHISILFGLLSTMTFRKRFLTALVGYPVLFFFAALTGFTPSVVRSCLMWGLVLLAKLAEQEYDGPTSLSFAVLVMLVLNPMVITAVGFQLSVASVAGIYLFSPGIVVWLRSFTRETKGKSIHAWLIRWGTTSVSITMGALILTTPLCAYYFGTVSLVGVLTNLLTLWVITILFYGIMAVCLLYWTIPGAAAVVAGIISWSVRYVLWVAEIVADFPLAAVYTSSPYITAWLVFMYVMLMFFLISKNRKPRILGCCAMIGLCLALMADWTESLGYEVRMTVLDVGQGQCILLQSDGRSFVVDCGGDFADEASDQAAEALLRQGIHKLDGLVLTHLDEDHAGGAAGLLSRLETKLLILPEAYSELPFFTDAQVICVTQPVEIAIENTVLSIIPATFPGNSNEKSLCVLFDTEKCDILITSDRDAYGERSLLRNHSIPDVDVLVAGHHGSASSSCEELLEAVKPEIVCISTGAGNIYGHPAPELLQRLAAYGCGIYRTDVQGTITIRR